jgi:hypothetical protein
MSDGVPGVEGRASGAEIERLRARVAMLESQVTDVEAWANRAVAEAQARTYWLDRWHVDLNALMRRRSADRARAAARRARSVYRSVRSLQRRAGR